ncbi:MAG: hypothetical protein ACRD0K_27710 [Egibacteraceae bacterium]
MARIDDLLKAAFERVGPKPPESGTAQAVKKRYSEQISNALAYAFAEELRHRGMTGAKPSTPGEASGSGAERRMAGAIGAKKVDVTWATEESGLLLGISMKTINWRDSRTQNFQKNLTNRRGDLLIEAVTLHRWFPYAVMCGLLFLDYQAATDGTAQRRSTFDNAHPRLKLFTGRNDPAGRDEQYERLYIVMLDGNPFNPSCLAYEAGDPITPHDFHDIITALVQLVAERNPDFYEEVEGNLRRV